MDITFIATFENGLEHKYAIHITPDKGQTMTDAFVVASRVAGTITDSPIVKIYREDKEVE